MVQVITGILLTIYYQPTPDTAYDSILFIMNEVNFGWLIRSIHAWGANLMILFCVLHLLRIFFQGVYKAPREITWVAGIFLLAVTLGFGFTGYLLPWDQRAFWATTVGTEIPGGAAHRRILLVFLRSGPEITARTLSRFYGIHVLVMPASLVFLLAIHLTLVHQQGLADPTGSAQPEPAYRARIRKIVTLLPNYILDEFIAWYVMLAILIILASLSGRTEEPANPLVTPEHTKPEWYFLFLYQWLKVVPRLVGVLTPLIGGLVLLLLPLIDRNPYFPAHKRPVAVAIGAITVIAVIFLTIWGWLS
jgi:quinol-cytochrome oxidoreductase complex cytochrome b subunit